MESSVGTMTIRALRSGSSDDFAELTRLCTDDVVFTSAVSSPASGPREVVQTLERFQAAGRFAKTETWESVATTAGITVIATLPLSSFYQRYEWNIALDETGKIRAIAQIGVAQTAPLPPAPVALTAEITQARWAWRGRRETHLSLPTSMVTDSRSSRRGEPPRSSTRAA